MTYNKIEQIKHSPEVSRLQPRLKFYERLYAFAISETGKKSSNYSQAYYRNFSPYPPYFPLVGKIRRGGKSIS